LRYVGLVEGVSAVLLFFVAMPLKYLDVLTQSISHVEIVRATVTSLQSHVDGVYLVKVVGAAHGGLWVLFILAASDVAIRRRWSVVRMATAFVASVVPGGTFLFDRTLQREQAGAELVAEL
jgi:integral membrane protein